MSAQTIWVIVISAVAGAILLNGVLFLISFGVYKWRQRQKRQSLVVLDALVRDSDFNSYFRILLKERFEPDEKVINSQETRMIYLGRLRQKNFTFTDIISVTTEILERIHQNKMEEVSHFVKDKSVGVIETIGEDLKRVYL